MMSMPQIFLMISVMIFLLLTLLQNYTDNLMSVKSLENPSIGGFQKLYASMNVDAREKGQGFVVVEKFRMLLELKRFVIKKTFRGNAEFLPSSPSPAPAPAPAPAPTPHWHFKPRKPNHWKPEAMKHTSHGISLKKTFVVALVLVGFVFLACCVGLIWGCRKYVKALGRVPKRIFAHRKVGKGGGSHIRSRFKYGGSLSSVCNKVSFNPGIDLLYLESLGADLERQETSPCDGNLQQVKSHSDSPVKEGAKLVLDDASVSSTREIMSVHDDGQPVLYHSGSARSSSSDNRIIPIANESHSSDEESFHSAGDSRGRLSNGSLGSASESSGPRDLSKTSSSVSDSVKTCLPEMSSGNTNDPNNTEPGNSVVISLGHPPPPPPPPPRYSYKPSPSARVMQKSIPLSPNKSMSSSGDSYVSSLPSKTPSLVSVSPSGIPPPPAPPPLKSSTKAALKGHNPPPPPSRFPESPPLNKDGLSLPKLKPLHWDKVRTVPDQTMVWDKLGTSSFELDEEMMESLFGYNIQTPLITEDGKSRTPSPTKHVLNPKRIQNITILSKALNAAPEQVRDALLRGKGLCQQQLEALIKMVPMKEEETKLNGYKGDVNELGCAEKFVMVLLGIPFASQRIEALLYRETFEDEILLLSSSFSMLEEACKELRSSRLFLKLLEAVLKTGNRMNIGTIRGGAKAFKLGALLKLADIKGTDGKTTLLHFVVLEIVRSEGIRVSDSIMGKIDKKNRNRTPEEKEEDYKRMGLDLVGGLSTELYNVKKTATIDLDVLASSVSNLSEGMSKLRDLIAKNDVSSDDKGREFGQSMQVFLGYAEKRLKKLKEDEDRVLARVREITEYFHGNTGKDETNLLQIFVIVRDFMGMLDHVCKELRSYKVPSSPMAPFR